MNRKSTFRSGANNYLTHPKKNKGITLVALIITIIVMLILVTITVSILINSNLIVKAKDAGRSTQTAYNSESNFGESMTINVDGKIYSSIEKITTPELKWTYNHATQTVTNGELTLKIGDKITGYESPAETTYTGDWRVLGEENGKLLIVIDTAYAPFDGATAEVGPSQYGLQIAGDNSISADAYGIDGGIAMLNAIGATYENETYANVGSGRSINLADINRITGYDPTNTYLSPNDLTIRGPYGYTGVEQYGNKVKYTLKSDGKVWYQVLTPVETTETKGGYSKFIPYQSTEIASGESYIIESSSGFFYYIDTLGWFKRTQIPSENQANADGVAPDSLAYDMIKNCMKYSPYWLASPYVAAVNR